MAVTYWSTVATAYMTCLCVLNFLFLPFYRLTAIPREPGHTQPSWDLRHYQGISKKIVPIDLVSDHFFLLDKSIAL